MIHNKKKTTNTPPHKGVLHPTKSRAHYHLEQYSPSEDLLPFIDQFWYVEWDLSKQQPHSQQNLPQPNIHITFEHDKTIVYGPVKQRFTRLLSGKGNIFGIKFTIGGFVPVIEQAMIELVDTQTELQNLLTQQQCEGAACIGKEKNIEKKIQLAENFLNGLYLDSGTTKNNARSDKHLRKISLAKKITSLIETTPSITKVEQLCKAVNVNSRTLQRLFQSYIGVNPKWLIRKYRIHEILIRLEHPDSYTVDWQQIALDLEYVDQAHLINDFKSFIGYTPKTYLQRNC